MQLLKIQGEIDAELLEELCEKANNFDKDKKTYLLLSSSGGDCTLIYLFIQLLKEFKDLEVDLLLAESTVMDLIIELSKLNASIKINDYLDFTSTHYSSCKVDCRSIIHAPNNTYYGDRIVYENAMRIGVKERKQAKEYMTDEELETFDKGEVVYFKKERTIEILKQFGAKIK